MISIALAIEIIRFVPTPFKVTAWFFIRENIKKSHKYFAIALQL
jgi:hypothetical protein